MPPGLDVAPHSLAIRCCEAPPVCGGCRDEEPIAMCRRWGQISQGVICLWVSGLVAGCAAPSPAQGPFALCRPAADSSVQTKLPTSAPRGRQSPPVAAVLERPGRIRLTSHDAESETLY